MSKSGPNEFLRFFPIFLTFLFVTQYFSTADTALKGGLTPVIAFLGPAMAGLLAGSFVVETIFGIPGLGRFYVEAAFNRDYTMILGLSLIHI